MKKGLIILGLVSAVIVGAILLISGSSTQTVKDSSGNEVRLGSVKNDSPDRSKANDFTLTSYDDKLFRLSEVNKDKSVVIQFWATWCEICRHEFPNNNKIAQKYKDKITYFAIDWNQSNKNAVRDYISELGLDPTAITFVLDSNGEVGSAYGVRGTPVHVFIKKGGAISFKNAGGLSSEQMENEIQKII